MATASNLIPYHGSLTSLEPSEQLKVWITTAGEHRQQWIPQSKPIDKWDLSDYFSDISLSGSKG